MMDASVKPGQAMDCLAQADVLLWLAGWLRPAAASELLVGESALRGAVQAAGLDRSTELGQAMWSVHEAAANTEAQALKIEHHRLFDAGMACAVNESAYVRRDKGAILGDICGFYRAFGFEAGAATSEKPDHLGCELEFVALLLCLLARARERGEAEPCQVTEQALASFCAEHVDVWLGAFCQRLESVSGLAFYEALAGALQKVWGALREYHDWPRGEGAVVGEPVEDVGTPYECGMSAGGEVEVRIGGGRLEQ